MPQKNSKELTSLKKKLLLCLGLTLVTLAVYRQVGGHEFITLDDEWYIVENSKINAGFTRDGLIGIFTETHAGNWHPLTSLSHMLDVELFGLNAGRHHLVNALFHAANTLLLLLVLNRMTGSLWCSGFVAAAFALHPLHVESVAWVSERKDVLSSLFWMLTMWAYAFYTDRPSVRRYSALVAFFGFGLAAKQMLVTLPFVLLLLDYWPLGRIALRGHRFENPVRNPAAVSIRRAVLEKLPLFILSGLAAAMVYIVQQHVGIVKSAAKYPLSWRIANGLVAYIAYLGKMVWPSKLAIFYPHPRGDWLLLPSVVAALLLVGITSAAIWRLRRQPYLAVGWLWYLGTLIPVIGLVQVFDQAMADRYTYIPLIGIFIMVAWGLGELAGKWKYGRKMLCPAAVAILMALSACTYHQLRYWRSSRTLFEHALKVTRNNYMAHSCLGKSFLNQHNYQEAIKHYDAAVKIEPSYSEAQHNLAVLYYAVGSNLERTGEREKAGQQYIKALQHNRKHQNARNHLAAVLDQLGKINEAVEHGAETVQLFPDDAAARFYLAEALAKQNRNDESIVHYRHALKLKHADAKAHNGLANALNQQGKTDEAVKHFALAVRLKPDYLGARVSLAECMMKLGRIEAALEQYRQILRFEPNHVEAASSLGWIWATAADSDLRNPAKAVESARKACAITSYTHPKALDALAAALAASGSFSDAAATAEKAMRMAKAAGQNNLAREIEKRLELYKSGKPYRMKEFSPAR